MRKTWRTVAQTLNVLFLVIDLFCGAGGTTSGFEKAEIDGKKIAMVIGCVNHDRNAIMSHKFNNPKARHFIEDIRTFDPKKLTALIDKWKAIFPNAKVILWASLECTNFSNAKGGLPRDADSRTLAEYLEAYIQAYPYNAVMIENVVEFLKWGPLTKKGKPVKNKLGVDFKRWCKMMCSYGYTDKWGNINAADLGQTQSRKRLFGIFTDGTVPDLFPMLTHNKTGTNGLQKWVGVRKDLDLNDEGESIFSRKKPIVDATLRRLYAGLIKHVAGGKEHFTSTYYSGSDDQRNHGLNEPVGAITTANRHAIVKSVFVYTYGYKTPQDSSIADPCGTLMTKDRHAMVTSEFLAKYYGNGDNTSSLSDPSGTLTVKDRIALVQCHKQNFIDQQYGKSLPGSIDVPIGAVTVNPKAALVDVFMDNQYGTGVASSVDKPAMGLTAIPKNKLVKCFIYNSNFGNVGSSVDDPSPSILASRKHHYLVNPGWFGHTGSVNEPSCTIVARQDKAPISVVNVEMGEIIIPVYDDDSEHMIKIKEFMAAYGIVDIKMRMLKIPELLRIQGFPDDYILYGTQTQRKKYIGNAVVPLVVAKWAEAIGNEILKQAA
jgi:DNA (cytosine-5)-methyltransferase 1